MNERQNASAFDLNALLHPANAFAHPRDVIGDPDLTLQEKRAILASWASDACALEAAHELRLTPSGATVKWDDIMDALQALDREAQERGVPKRQLWPIRVNRSRADGGSLSA